MLGQWTPTDAFNDADDIFHAIVQSQEESMSTQGDFDLFATAFPSRLLPDVIRLMLDEWPNVSRPQRKPLENRITNRFAGHLQRTMRTYDRPQFRFACRPKLPTPDADSESGELDIEVTAFSPHPDAFLVVECKRLNVQKKAGFASLAGEYVGSEGMGCFISGQYSSGGDEGIMLGYVMTRTVSEAIDSINLQLEENHVELGLVPPKNHYNQKRGKPKNVIHELFDRFKMG